MTQTTMSSTRAREACDDAEKDNLEDLSDEELDALLAEEYAEQEEEEAVPVPRSETAKKASKASKKKPAKAAADALKQDSADGPPIGTALVMLAVSAVSAVVVFAMRAARRKQSPAPKRADTPAPTLAVDGASAQTQKNNVAPARRRASAAQKKPVPAAARRCANCGATQPKKKEGAVAAAKLLRCGGCRATYYCSSECQRQHRPVHKKDCVPPAGTSAPATQSAAASAAARAPEPAAAAAAKTAPEPAAPDDAAAAAAAAAEGARRFKSLRARLGAATGAFRRGAIGQAVSALQDIAMEAHELFDQHKLGRDVECEALRVAGHGMIRMRAWEPAEKCLDACLGVARAGLEDDPPLPPGAAIGAFVALGTLASTREPPEFDLSQQWFAQALQVAREAGDVAAEASVCQSLAGVAGKMGDGAAAAQAAEMALGLRRAKVEEARQMLVAAENELAAFVAPGGTRNDAEGAPAASGVAPPITSPEHARAFGAAAVAKRALAEARRAEVAALANVGAALLKVEAADSSEASASAAGRSGTPEDAPPSPATRVAAGVARYEEALASLRQDAAGPQDLEMEIGLLLELANAHDNRVGGASGRARAREMRASLRDAVKALTANQREFPNTCTLCSKAMDPIEGEGSDEASSLPADPDAPVTCLECLHGYHSACLLRWREQRLVEEMRQIEKAEAEGEDVSGRKPQKPRCPDCANIHARRAAAAEAAQRQQQSQATEGFL